LLSVEDWAGIRRLHRAEGLPIKLIARTLGISRNTVRAALAADGPSKYERKPAGSAVDAFDDAIRVQLTMVPTMPATVIAERVGWTRGMTVFNERVRELRPAYLPPDPAGRTTYDAGDIAQCDLWFPPTTIPVGYGQTRSPMQLPVLTMGAGVFTVALGDAAALMVCGGSVRRLVAADQRSWRCGAPWSGTVKARSGGGGRAGLS
jgi:hypothetical protein